ncbi:PREDICTED: probable elongator complex protein 2 [Dinoponera quadriceps]|uniref:Elongator complex protein 2 n=1 Tax=Dinoponera quadriceps TaxID=609295 RepID=A0A6P3WZA2_DINQU|nr:PREDICTED: probable elongator complex protein 2 [Dinoponera quadriceps]
MAAACESSSSGTFRDDDSYVTRGLDMTTPYISCSCNRVPHCADWASNNGLVCFGACNAVAIYDPRIGRVVNTLHRHRDRVSTVHWIRPRDGTPETELLSCSVDGTVIIWSKDFRSFRDSSTLDVGCAVTFADSLRLLTDDTNTLLYPRLLICVGTGNELKVCSREDNTNVEVVQTMVFGRKFSLHCRLTCLPDTKHLLMAVALEDSSVVLCTANEVELNFVTVQSLSGHQDWVKCMDFCHDDDDGSIFLATGSEDITIRLWKISKAIATSSNDELVQKREIFTIDDIEYSVTLETLLYGHESWVYGVHWRPIKREKSDDCRSMRRLLSSSFDKSMIIWKLDDTTGIWTEEVRVGEVGGNSLGFYGCKFGPDGLRMLGYDYQGSFHIWKYSQEIAKWLPQSAPSGHFSEVVDLCWEPKGRFLLTASTDKTTRIHAPWKDDLEEHWHEIARPQVHGHDMSCLVMLAPYIYASGAEEKVVRVFTATSAFRDRLRLLADVEDFKFIAARGAAVSSLGLTNKATFDGEVIECENAENSTANYCEYETLTEEKLTQNTLWPELQKLYGHGYEIFCMAARHDGCLLATACKSTNLEHAAIILWSTTTWSQVQRLVSHQLTVTQMEFSPNDKYLLSVSRDRKWSLFKNHDGGYALLATSSKNDSPHSRIIWCCAWTRDSNYFATGSRDGKVGIWSVRTEEDNINVVRETTLDTQNRSVTAVCFAPSFVAQGSYVLAVGYEIGHIDIYTLTVHPKVVKLAKLVIYDTSEAHHLTVKRLKFQPSNEQSSNILRLASCSSDHIVKIRDIDIDRGY